jgi:transcriptional regulator with XRE-family HTH domain
MTQALLPETKGDLSPTVASTTATADAGRVLAELVGSVVREFRGSLSIEKASKLSGYSAKGWRLLERGERLPRIDRYQQILEALEVSPVEFEGALLSALLRRHSSKLEASDPASILVEVRRIGRMLMDLGNLAGEGSTDAAIC